ncbi:MAG: glyoxalase superfamily protein [Rubrivivax sp.]
MALTQTTPILRSADATQMRRFYIDFLGFELLFEHRFEPHLPLYCALKRDACELHLSEHTGDSQPGAGLRIAVDDIDALAAELAAKSDLHPAPQVETMPWGTRDFSVTDPVGNRLTFTSAVSL